MTIFNKFKMTTGSKFDNFSDFITSPLMCLLIIVIGTLILLPVVSNGVRESDNEAIVEPQVTTNSQLQPTEEVLEFDFDINYTNLIIDCANTRTNMSFEDARDYEMLRNLKIEYTGGTNTSSYFTKYNSWTELFNDDEALEYFGIKKYSIETDYMKFIEDALKYPTDNSFEAVKNCEELNNLKIDDLNLNELFKTNYFTNYNSWEELFLSDTMDSYYLKKDYRYVVNQSSRSVVLKTTPSNSSKTISRLYANTFAKFLGSIVNDNGEIWFKVEVILSSESTIGFIKAEYLNAFQSDYSSYDFTESDVYWLAVAITMEGGCSWYPEYVRNYIGCVILNRVESDIFKSNTIYDILHEPGQYPWATAKNYKEPFEWCINSARDILSGNRLLPSNVVFQAEFRQGNYTYAQYTDDVLGTTFYFCGIK